MSQWAHDNPEKMAEIASLPMGEQNAAMRASVGYDPDRIRDEFEERDGFCRECGSLEPLYKGWCHNCRSDARRDAEPNEDGE